MSRKAPPPEGALSFGSFSLGKQRKEHTAGVLHRKSNYGVKCRNRMLSKIKQKEIKNTKTLRLDGKLQNIRVVKF
jgi:hypothetical protein